MEDTKQCPYCGGTVLVVARKCKHCGQWIENVEMENCPVCNEEIIKGLDVCPFCNENIKEFRRESVNVTGVCPLCKEKIPQDVNKCPYCNEDIIKWMNYNTDYYFSGQNMQSDTASNNSLAKIAAILITSIIILLMIIFLN